MYAYRFFDPALRLEFLFGDDGVLFGKAVGFWRIGNSLENLRN